MSALQIDRASAVDALTALRTNRWVRSTVAVYLILWVLEGAFRKWIPSTSLPFYVIRDVLLAAMVLVLVLMRTKRYGSARWFWVLAIPVTGLVSVQVLLGSVSPEVAALGLRSYLAPALFIAAVAVWGNAETLAVVRRLVFCAIPLQLALCTVQVFSPARSWINAQVGSDEASFINFGVVRPAGTFSAPAGLATFVPIALAFALFEFSAHYKKKGLVAALMTGMTLTIVAISGSRGLVLAAAVTIAFYLLCALLSWRRVGGLPLAPLLWLFGVIGTVGVIVLSTVINSFVQRFSDASQSENPLARLVTQALGFIGDPTSFLGSGAGTRSQVGIAAGSGLTWLEIDNQRWVAELGLIGYGLALARVVAFVALCVVTLRQVKRSNWLFVLVSAGFLPTLFSGSLTQTPSAQAGFAITAALLILIMRSHSPPVSESSFAGSSAGLRTTGEPPS